jgi:1-deoxy-D-xylulose-5-phosphate reductoisomerase
MKKISILGATGSIGTQTLDVIKNDKENFELSAISANSNYKKVINIIDEFNPKLVSMVDLKAYDMVKNYCKENNKNTVVLNGVESLVDVATFDDADIVVTSVVGMVGLVPTLKAIEKGKDIALANKETLVVGGDIVTKAAELTKVKLLPVDSEHGAIFQCMQGNHLKDISKIILTASGGPFRNKKREDLIDIKPNDALKHPKWQMGRKISIDSATLMNKGLEVIEAHFLFNMNYDNIQVVVHPESVIHSMIEYNDGSIIAQLASTDMRLPIQYAINYPERKKAVIDKLDFYTLKSLSFEKPDMETFKCLKLCYEAGKKGGNMTAILNGANEVAVDLFLNNKISFLQIEEIIERCLNKFEYKSTVDLDTILDTDKKVRKYVFDLYK